MTHNRMSSKIRESISALQADPNSMTHECIRGPRNITVTLEIFIVAEYITD